MAGDIVLWLAGVKRKIGKSEINLRNSEFVIPRLEPTGPASGPPMASEPENP
jgi:hypothetical protein